MFFVCLETAGDITFCALTPGAGVYYTTQVQGARASQGAGRRPRAIERGFLDQAVHNGPESFTARLPSLLFQFRSTQKCEMERVREGVTHLAPCRAQCELRCIALRLTQRASCCRVMLQHTARNIQPAPGRQGPSASPCHARQTVVISTTLPTTEQLGWRAHCGAAIGRIAMDSFLITKIGSFCVARGR